MAARNINSQEFLELTSLTKPVLVDFWAPWCGYCRRIGPALDKIADSREDVTVVKVNIDEEPELALQERIEVIPTLVVYQNGKDLASAVAPESRARIEALISEALQKQ